MIVETTLGPLDLDHAREGRLLLRWWFPKASTPHCALQARALLDSWSALAEHRVDLVGLSFDPLDALAAWSANLGGGLTLVHGDLALADRLGAARPLGDPWREVIPRRVFDLIDDRGQVLARQDVTDAHEFVEQVLGVLRGVPA